VTTCTYVHVYFSLALICIGVPHMHACRSTQLTLNYPPIPRFPSAPTGHHRSISTTSSIAPAGLARRSITIYYQRSSKRIGDEEDCRYASRPPPPYLPRSRPPTYNLINNPSDSDSHLSIDRFHSRRRPSSPTCRHPTSRPVPRPAGPVHHQPNIS
jgi:hypothetical protein